MSIEGVYMKGRETSILSATRILQEKPEKKEIYLGLIHS
jgi:hypothetical protein